MVKPGIFSSWRGFIKTAAAAALGLVAWPLHPTGFHP